MFINLKNINCWNLWRKKLFFEIIEGWSQKEVKMKEERKGRGWLVHHSDKFVQYHRKVLDEVPTWGRGRSPITLLIGALGELSPEPKLSSGAHNSGCVAPMQVQYEIHFILFFFLIKKGQKNIPQCDAIFLLFCCCFFYTYYN